MFRQPKLHAPNSHPVQTRSELKPVRRVEGSRGPMNRFLPVDSEGSPVSPLRTRTHRIEWAIVVITCAALCIWMVFRPFFISHFDATVGDPADGRFELTLLEHWAKVFHGEGQVASPNFFYPVKGVLGYSDAFLGLAIPHAIFRSLGADRYLAVQLSTMLFTALGFAAMYFLLRRPLRFSRSIALLGASLFVISNMYYIYAAHSYILVSVMMVPAIFLLASGYWHNKDLRPIRARLWLCLSAMLLALVLYTSYYIGWFLIVCSTALWVVFVACRVYARPGTDLWGHTQNSSGTDLEYAAGRGCADRVPDTFLASVSSFAKTYWQEKRGRQPAILAASAGDSRCRYEQPDVGNLVSANSAH